MRAIEKKSRKALLWALCLSLVVLATGTAWAEDPKLFDLKVSYDGFSQTLSGVQRREVPKGATVTLQPMLGLEKGSFKNVKFDNGQGAILLDVGKYDQSILVGAEVTCTFTFTWINENGKETPGYAKVTLVPTTNLSAWIVTYGDGTGLLMPGSTKTFKVETKTLETTPSLTYTWEVRRIKDGGPIEQEGLYSLTATPFHGEEVKLYLADNSNSYMLDGAMLFCTVTNTVTNTGTEQSILAGPVDLKVGIKVQPAATDKITMVSGRVENNNVRATLALTSVTGGNKPYADLKYLVQERGVNSNEWVNLSEVEGSSYSVNVERSKWDGDRDYRFIVARAGAADWNSGTKSGIYRVTLDDTETLTLRVSDGVTLEPESGVVAQGTLAVSATLEKAANKTPAETTIYTYKIFALTDEENNTWTEITPDPMTTKGALPDKAGLSVSFTPLEGAYDYVLRVSSNASTTAVDQTEPFRLFRGTKGDVSVTGTSNPAAQNGLIRIREGKPIEYYVWTTGGTGKWEVKWLEGEQRIEHHSGTTWTDTSPVHNTAVTATAVMLGFDGEAVEGYNFPVSFGTPWVRLEWAMDLEDYLFIPKDKLMDGGSVTVTPAAKGGSGYYDYYWMIADARDPDPSVNNSGWTPMAPATYLEFFQKHIGAIKGSGTEIFDIWLKAVDRSGQSIIGSQLLYVTESSTVMISGWLNGKNIIVWADEDSYISTVNANQMPELRADLAASSETAESFRWSVDGVAVEHDEATWTPDLAARNDPYEIAVDALGAGGTVLASANILMTVGEAVKLDATAALSPATVDPEAKVTLTTTVTTPAADETYSYKMGTSSQDIDYEEDESANPTSVYTFNAPSEPGTYTYYWSVTADSSDAKAEGELELTVRGTAPAFTIKPESGASFVVGSTFKLVVTSETGITASQLNWTSDATDIATVDSQGKVTVKKAGFVTVTAALKDDDNQKRYYGFPTTDEPAPVNYTVSIPALNFKKGTAGEARFTSTPAGADFTYEGTLPKGMTLSTAGLLSGTPTESGTFTLTELKAAWDNGQVKIENGVKITVKGDSGGGGGGCNGGFGIFALALSAFAALKRR